jgi:hypothetical protein
MRKTLLILFSGLALAIPSVAFADPADTSSAAAAAPEPMAQTSALPHAEHTEAQTASSATQVSAKGEKLICHHPVHEGTVLPQEICLTQEAWDRVRRREQKNVNDWELHGYQAGVH